MFASNFLTYLESETNTMTGTGNLENLLKFALKKFVKSHQVNLFSVDFSFLKSLCEVSEGPLDSLTLLSKPV